MSTYTVQHGDTLHAIASGLHSAVNILEFLNPGINPDEIQIGQDINVPSTGSYTILAGDTFSTIASTRRTKVKILEGLNPGVDPNDLQIGQIIRVPGVAGPIPVPNPLPTNNYVSYSGPASNFPDPSTWADYDSLWAFNATIIPNVSLPGLEAPAFSLGMIGTYIPLVAAESGVDARLILCIIMQESGGYVLVPTTPSPGPDSIPNTGIMQAHDGATLQLSPWPALQASIYQMIRDGTEGTATGPGLKQLIAQYQGNVYEAVRAYNSGSVNTANLSDGLGATDSYVSDVANRLQGHIWPGM